jgi:hypothetical protein
LHEAIGEHPHTHTNKIMAKSRLISLNGGTGIDVFNPLFEDTGLYLSGGALMQDCMQLTDQPLDLYYQPNVGILEIISGAARAAVSSAMLAEANYVEIFTADTTNTKLSKEFTGAQSGVGGNPITYVITPSGGSGYDAFDEIIDTLCAPRKPVLTVSSVVNKIEDWLYNDDIDKSGLGLGVESGLPPLTSEVVIQVSQKAGTVAILLVGQNKAAHHSALATVIAQEGLDDPVARIDCEIQSSGGQGPVSQFFESGGVYNPAL